MSKNYPWNLLSDLYDMPIDESSDLMIGDKFLDIKRLPSIINEQPDEIQEYIRLRYKEGMTYARIAKAMGVTAYKVDHLRSLTRRTYRWRRLLVNPKYKLIADNPWEDLLLVFLNETGGLFLTFSEGIGDNLLKEDIAEGFVDYLNWSSYSLSTAEGYPMFAEEDGGMVMLKQYARDMSPVDIVEAVRDEALITPRTPFEVIISQYT